MCILVKNDHNSREEAFEVKGVPDVLGLNGPVRSPKGNWEMTAEHLSGCFCQLSRLLTSLLASLHIFQPTCQDDQNTVR